MSLSRPVQPWYRVDITLKAFADQTTKTIKLISREPRGESSQYFPILKSVNSIGMVVGQDGMPAKTSGNIVIYDHWQSFGAERRFSDLLERYTCIEQPIAVYACQTQISDVSPDADFALVWSGVCKSASRSAGDAATFTLRADPIGFEQRYISTQISASMAPSVTETVPTKSIGKALPLVFGDVSRCVPAYPISDTTASFAYATNMHTTFETSTDSVSYIKNASGVYKKANAWDSAWWKYSAGGNEKGSGSGVSYDQPAQETCEKEIITPLCIETIPIPYYGFCITAVRWWFRSQGAITVPAGDLRFNIYQATVAADSDPVIETPIASGKIAKSTFGTDFQSTLYNGFFVDCYLDKPVVITPSYLTNTTIRTAFDSGSMIFVGMVATQTTGSTATDFVSGPVRHAYAEKGWWRRDSGAAVPLYQNTSRPYCELAIAGFSAINGSTDTNGYRWIGVQGSQVSCTTGTAPDLSQLDMIVQTKGLKDDSSGTITGTPSALISRPDHIVNLLQRKWNGSAWVDSANFDFTTYSSAFTSAIASYSRKYNGQTNGNTLLEKELAEVAKQMCVTFIPLTTGKMAVWPWGWTPSVAKVFGDDDITEILGWDLEDASSVVNAVSIAWGADYLRSGVAYDGNYESMTGVYAPTGSPAAAVSKTLFGTRVLEDLTTERIGDSTSAASYAEFIHRVHDAPHWTMRFTAPMYENRTLELMDVIEILSAEMPAFFGTSLDGRYPVYSGTEIDLWAGAQPVRAKRYRCQIIGREQSFTDGQQPQILFTVRILKPYHSFDPTAGV